MYSHCVSMSTSKEWICCQEIMKMNEKMEEAEIPELLCITEYCMTIEDFMLFA